MIARCKFTVTKVEPAPYSSTPGSASVPNDRV